MSVTYASGFRAAGVAAGFKSSGRPDLAMLVGDPGTTTAGLFTTNRVQAAPVRLSRARLAEGEARAVLVNSGQANAATGDRGDRDAIAATAAAAEIAGLGAGELLSCSTGVIGEPLHMDRLTAALPGLTRDLSPKGGVDFAHAITTTDTVPKSATAEAGPLKVGGSAKGVGMIAPNLATMLTFVTTDAVVAAPHLQLLAEEVLKPRFNALTVDACQSTNDTVLLFASGAAGSLVEPGSPAWGGLAEGLEAVGDSLAQQLIHDAEGVTHVLIVAVEGAETDEAARRVAKAIADSPLVKTAAFGQDPNPGRIVQAIGSAGVAMDPRLIDVWLGHTQVVAAGVIPVAYFDGDLHEHAAKQMTEPEIAIRVSLGPGPGNSRALGCDLSYEYVRINGEYTT